MTPQERELILGLFQRLNPPVGGDVDGEARELIDRLGREQPLALYLLAQTALVQEHALKGAQARIAELEAELTQAPPAGATAAPSRRSFLSGLLGGAPTSTRPTYAPQPAAPVAASPTGPWGSPGPSFLQSALTTAAGVAGGALLFQGIEHLLGYGGSPFAHTGWSGAPGFAQSAEGTGPQDVAAGNSDPGQGAVDPGNDPSLDTTQVDDPGFDRGGDGFGDGGGFQDV
jgi:hypothetical protein